MQIDIEALREYLVDCCGTAAFGGFPAAVMDLADVESMSPAQLCEKAQDLGIDLCKFEAR